MVNREPIRLRVLTAMWNFLLSAFSIAGAALTVPQQRVLKMAPVKHGRFPIKHGHLPIKHGHQTRVLSLDGAQEPVESGTIP